MIEKSFSVKGFPLIGSGYMKSGYIKLNQTKKYYIGPFNRFNPQFYPITIRTIHDDDKHYIDTLREDEVGCISFNSIGNLIANKKQLRSGMIITDNPNIICSRYFTASINIIPGNHTTLKKHSMLFIHCGMIRQPVYLKNIMYNGQEVEIARHNVNKDSNYTINFEFTNKSNYICVGDIFLFREGKIHGNGKVISLGL
jgi:GTPase